ncbi:MAG: PHP domain-containing protein [Treponema sp.]|nr:PHP domain-containing protein [Treponema sp.]
MPGCATGWKQGKKEKMRYLYETHLHTSQASACAVSRGAEYIRAYKALGYTGIIVTDHFYNGNSRVRKNVPWREWVSCFCKGYEEAKAEGERLGLDVFFGWEETFDGDDDYLVYGLDKDWLLEHPEAAYWTREEQYRTVKENGGCVVQAHPFRQQYYIDVIRLSTGFVDAVEIANAGNADRSWDALAKRYAERLGLPATAGSDMHNAEQTGNGRMFGVYLDTKMSSIRDYVQAVKQNRLELKMTRGRCDWRGKPVVRLPVDIMDKDGSRSGQDIWEFLNTEKERPR